MARQRQRNNSTYRAPRETKSLAELVKGEVSAKIARARQRRAAERKAIRIPKELERPVTSESKRKELKRHGFYTTKKGVIVDGPRDLNRKPIKGSRREILDGGVIKTSIGQRRDYIYGFTKEEKKSFAENPGKTEREILARLKERFPNLRRRKLSVRLQWGAYQGTKGFNAHYFSKTYMQKFLSVGGKIDKTHRKIDALTGLHIVVHKGKK